MSETPSAREAHAVVDEFTYEVALLFFRMKLAATDFLGQGKHSSGRRSILKNLGRDGALTVPAMARARSVSRQHIQTLVNGLRADGLVTTRSNPAHKRSKLVVLTAAGRRFLGEMSKREEQLLSGLAEGMPLEDFRRATRLVRELKRRLESEEWSRAAAAARPAPSPPAPGAPGRRR